VASKGPLAIEGSYLWTLKEHIDNTWMDGYSGEFASTMMATSNSSSAPSSDLDTSPEAKGALSAASMRCGGCGSKVGSLILSSVLKQLRHDKLVFSRDEVLLGIGDDAAVVRPSVNMLQVHTVDYFRAFLQDNYLLGRIAGVHALSDIYAMGGEAITALATCVVPYGISHKVEEDLLQLISGVCATLADEKCALVGGHSSEGLETAVGITANGIVAQEHMFRDYTSVPGDRVILTKALGTGTLLAADMRAKARGVWVWRAVENMLRSNRVGAQILRRHGCTSCTDVTGFGLIGHLATLFAARDTAHVLALDLMSIPLLDGALETIIEYPSSLQLEVLSLYTHTQYSS
jgi:selenide,water dikinase